MLDIEISERLLRQSIKRVYFNLSYTFINESYNTLQIYENFNYFVKNQFMSIDIEAISLISQRQAKKKNVLNLLKNPGEIFIYFLY